MCFGHMTVVRNKIAVNTIGSVTPCEDAITLSYSQDEETRSLLASVGVAELLGNHHSRYIRLGIC